MSAARTALMKMPTLWLICRSIREPIEFRLPASRNNKTSCAGDRRSFLRIERGLWHGGKNRIECIHQLGSHEADQTAYDHRDTAGKDKDGQEQGCCCLSPAKLVRALDRHDLQHQNIDAEKEPDESKTIDR